MTGTKIGAMLKINKLLIISILCSVLFASCQNNIFEKNTTISKGEWSSKNIVKFEFQSTDSLTVSNVFVNVRHTGLYKYSNLYLFVSTEAPNGMIHKDTMQFILADVNGKWQGSGIGDVFDLRLAYKKNIKFGQVGKYKFSIQHAMRNEVLDNITDVGIRIEKAK
jgi:gliding motility-associated lipoprotein GldH